MSDLHVLDDPAAVARAAAERIAASAAARIAARGRFSLGLSGGRTPERLYRLLASSPLREAIEWPRVRLYFADERAVPPTDPASNFRMARETLIDHVAIPPPQVHRLKGDYADLAAAAEEYEARLAEPIDLLILGLGEDGHTASIFPGSAAAREREHRVVVVTDSPKPPASRLTITPRVIDEAREVMMLATGSGKADAVARSLAEGADPLEVPAAFARSRGWWIDRDASARLDLPGARGPGATPTAN
jgi:6-phosphogluconolactonase